MTPQRSIVLWVPDWPVFAAFGPRSHEIPCALVHDNTIVACSAAARAQGVRRGQRRRLAQSLSPALRFLAVDPARDERAFLPVLRALEECVPDVHLLRPGLVAVRARGAARFYSGEEQAAHTLLRTLTMQGHADARAGVADGLFTAEQAARRADPVLVIPEGASAAFLAPLPVALLADAEVTSLLTRLGIRTMAQFAALPESDVRTRLGENGVRLHALAGGSDSRPFTPRSPDAELAREIIFETPLSQSDQIAFAVRQTADAVTEAVAELSAVCTEVRIDLTDDEGAVHTRTWLHPSFFDAAALVDRVRWQLESLHSTQETTDENRVSAGITEVRITPARIDNVSGHQPGLFGQGASERLHHGVSRVQALLGHHGVSTGSLAGGRLLADRQHLTPWGDRVLPERPPTRPWPGHLPGPLPTEVFAPPRPVRVESESAEPLHIDARGTLSAPPRRIEGSGVLSWSGPWPVRDRAWDVARGRIVHRLQLVDDRQRAWVVFHEDDQWWAEGLYR